MHFAWKDDSFLIKILTTIMIFIVVIMIAISPSFAISSIVNINDTDYEVSSYIQSFDYMFICKSTSYYYLNVFNSDYGYVRHEDDHLQFYGTYYSCQYSSKSISQLLSYGEGNFHDIGNSSSGVQFMPPGREIVYSNFDILDSSGEIYYPSDDVPNIQNPSFITSDEELSTGNFQTLKIDAGDFDSSDSEDINFGIFDITGREFGLSTIEELPNLMVYSTKLNFSSKYLVGENGGIFYYIPQSDLGIDLSNGKQYYFVLANDEGERFDQSIFTVGGLTAEEELKNKQDETNQKLDEANETNKGIWETIKEVLSYINPFSENFFVYKLIDLLIDAIKTLFIPSDDFFSTYFTNLQNWFSDRLGFLFYPFELIIDILNDILNIDFSEPQFTIPDINEPFTGKKLISATTFNFNDLLDNNVWNTVHNIYLILVDAAIVFGLVNLFHKKYEEVTTK